MFFIVIGEFSDPFSISDSDELIYQFTIFPSRKSCNKVYRFLLTATAFFRKTSFSIENIPGNCPCISQKPQRVIAYLHIHVMTLMVATLIERQLRIGMRRNSINSIPIYPEERPCKYPTTFDIVRLFKGIERYEVVQMTIFPLTY